MRLILLHLSDMHIKNSSDPILDNKDKIAACLFSELPEAAHLFLVVSGDIAFSGEVSQYTLARDFLVGIQAEIQREKNIPVSIIIAPGNHDCDFSKDTEVRRIVVREIGSSCEPKIESSIVETCTEIQNSFFEFRNSIEKNEVIFNDPLWRSCHFKIGETIIGFDSLNISWISQLHDEPGHLYFPIDLYKSREADNVDVRFLVLHHPLNWFNKGSYRRFRKFVRSLADILITGHEHMGDIGLIDDSESGENAFIEGCVLQEEKGLKNSSFNVVVIDVDKRQFKSSRYKWNDSHYIQDKEGSWAEYHDFTLKKRNAFAIMESFLETLEDPGAFFRHPKREKITLSEIFIYPDLRKLSDGEDKLNGEEKLRSFLSSKCLLSPEMTKNGILIEGEEKVGCTSLLYQLFLQYHEQGFVPLLIRGEDLKRMQEEEIDALISRTIEAQYGSEAIQDYKQLSINKKLLLLDDFDDGPIKGAKARADILCSLKKRFGHLVMSVNEMFELRELLAGDERSELSRLEHYKIQSFGYQLRLQLIKKWFSIDRDYSLDDGEIISQCDQAERLMDIVMSKRLIPSIPFYLLILLQSVEMGHSGNFKDSALGHYYHYLLVEALQKIGVRADKLTEVFQYIAQLAWEYHSRKKSKLSELELRDFNSRFSEKWHTVDFESRIKLLVRARVLNHIGEDFVFRYPYIYYYLKGQYLSENLADQQTCEYIEHCCKHLYVRDNAYTILFLAHHTKNDEYVLKTILETLRGLFQNRKPLTFDDDTNGISRLIEGAPELNYSGELPTQHRERMTALKDDLDDGGDGLAEKEEESDKLSVIAQMIVLFKTIEILGQVLKNQYATIQRPMKANLIDELFKGPLRALRDIYDLFEKNPDSLVSEIEAALARSDDKKLDVDERKSIARRIVAGIIQILSIGFVLKAASGANSDSLNEDVRAVVEQNGTLAFKLIDLCINLDSPKPLPQSKLESLLKQTEKDLIVSKIIKFFVINRLYMFKTSEKDMQWLSEKMKFDLRAQHAISYGKNKQKFIK